jgi:L-threonylcarbamoyladenylate synthase
MDKEQVIETLTQGGVGVLRTDTLYGLVGSAFSNEAVERIYDLKQRYGRKPFIVLIPSIEDIERFGVVISTELESRLKNYWPGPYSIILPTIDEEFEYLSRGTDSIAFRLPDDEELIEILSATGPLVAPSANIEGKPPATTVEEARRYFGDSIDFYFDGGEASGKASTVIRLDGEDAEVVRD